MTYQTAYYYNIRKSAFKNVRTLLLNAVSDIGTNVYGSYPLQNVNLPLIVVENGLVQPMDESETLEDINGQTVTTIVFVYDKQAEKIDTYMDTITSTIKNNDATFATYGMTLLKKGVVDNDNVLFTDFKNNRVHGKSISITFEVADMTLAEVVSSNLLDSDSSQLLDSAGDTLLVTS